MSAAEGVPGWPRWPTIVFEKVAASYRPELGRGECTSKRARDFWPRFQRLLVAIVLDDVTINIVAGEKVGV